MNAPSCSGCDSVDCNFPLDNVFAVSFHFVCLWSEYDALCTDSESTTPLLQAALWTDFNGYLHNNTF